jgi:predicted phosphohydrolase
MNIQLMSDLHLEMHRDKGASFLASLDPTDVDVLVLAGDVCYARDFKDILGVFGAKYKHVIYVTGNHEYYKSSPKETHALLEAALPSNVYWLNKTTVVLNNQRFIGGTLWFDEERNTKLYSAMINDYHLIKNFEPWVYQENSKLVNYLINHLEEDDIVVTHHLPSMHCVAEKYESSNLNAFFVHELDPLILDRKPKFWFHGHTHEQVDIMIGETRVLANPLGYPHEPGSLVRFHERLIVRS